MSWPNPSRRPSSTWRWASTIPALLLRFYDAVAKVFGVPRESAFGTCWVLFQQIEDGGWGALGRPLSIADTLSPAGFTQDREEDARRLLADRK